MWVSVGSVSVVVTPPDTEPLAPGVRVPLSDTSGSALSGSIGTVTLRGTTFPSGSVTVMVNSSVVGPLAAASWRAAASGV